MSVEQVNQKVGYQQNFRGEESKSNGSNPFLPALGVGALAGGGAYHGLKTSPTEDTFVQSIKDETLKTEKFTEAQSKSISEIKAGLDALPEAKVETVVADAAPKAKTVAQSLLESLPEGLKTKVTTVFGELKDTLPKVKNSGKAGLIGLGAALAAYVGLKLAGGSDKGEA